MKAHVKIDGITANENNKYKIKSMVETIAGVIKAHFPLNRFEIVYDDYLNHNVVDHRMYFGAKK